MSEADASEVMAPSELIPQLRVNADGVVIALFLASVPQDGSVEVDAETFAAAQQFGPGLCKWVGGSLTEYTPPAAPEPPPATISDRQFFQQLAVDKTITEAEALAAVQTGTLPAALQTLVDGIPKTKRFAASMLLTGATEFRFDHPLVGTISTAFGWSGEQLATFWRAAAAL